MVFLTDSRGREEELRALWHEAFPTDSAVYLDYLFANKYRPECCRALLDGDGIASMLHILPLWLDLRGKVIELPFLYGVATWKSRRNQGCARELIRRTVEELRDSGHCAIALYPFEHGFYRKLGFGVLNYNAAFTIDADRLAALGSVGEFFSPNSAQMNDIFASMCTRFGTHPVRDVQRCSDRLAEWSCDGGSAIACDGAYALLALEEESASVEELVYRDGRALRTLLAKVGEVARTAGCPTVSGMMNEREFPHAWFDNAWNLAHLNPGAMLRVVDVPRLLNGCQTALPAPLAIRVTDSLCPEIGGVFTLVPDGDRLHVQQGGQAQVECPVETLGALAAGGMDGVHAVAMGFAQAASLHDAELLAQAFPPVTTLFFDQY